MHNDLMLFYSLFFLYVSITITSGQQNIVYVKRGETAELCDNRSTIIFAYEYRSFDGKKKPDCGSGQRYSLFESIWNKFITHKQCQ